MTLMVRFRHEGQYRKRADLAGASMRSEPTIKRSIVTCTGFPLFEETRRGRRQCGASLSLDGHWIAYVSSTQGEHEVLVRPFPDVNARSWQASSGGGSAPRWSQSGRELFYANGNQMFAVQLHPEN